MSERAEPQNARSPRRAVTITLAVLLTCWYCFPAAVAGWVEDHCSDGPFCAGLDAIAQTIDGASRSVGVAGALESARDFARSSLGIDFY